MHAPGVLLVYACDSGQLAKKGEHAMSTDTALTVPTRFVEASGIRFAYRRWGKPGGLPLVFMQYFSANLDDWDPQVTDGLAADHDVILFDNAGGTCLAPLHLGGPFSRPGGAPPLLQ